MAKLLFLSLMILIFASHDSFAVWTGPFNRGYQFKNSNTQQDFENFNIEYSPLTRKFTIMIGLRNHGQLPGERDYAEANRRQDAKAEELRALLRSEQFSVDDPNIVLSGQVYVDVPIDNPERVKELIDKLNQVEVIDPPAMIERMKRKVEDELAAFHENVQARIRRRNNSPEVFGGFRPFWSSSSSLADPAQHLIFLGLDPSLQGFSGRLPNLSPSRRLGEQSAAQESFEQRIWEAHVEGHTHQRNVNVNVNLDKIKYTKVTKASELTEQQATQACAACMMDALEVVSAASQNELAKFPCDHLMCLGCAEEWIKYNQICPICRADIKEPAL